MLMEKRERERERERARERERKGGRIDERIGKMRQTEKGIIDGQGRKMS